jgi:uncharacterized membrane protein YjjP (DUF1212 family)
MRNHGDDPLTLAADVGRAVLEAGGETYRAEDAVIALCKAWGLSESECFATPTGLIASCVDHRGSGAAVVRRISRRSVDLNRISLISREIQREEAKPTTPQDFRPKFSMLANERSHSFPSALLASGIAAAFFTLLFQGSLKDAFSALIIGVILKASLASCAKQRLPDFIANMVGGAVAAATARFFVDFGVAENLDKTVIGSIMLLVPGLATVNAIRDTIAGDLVAGVSRLADAFMAAAAISLGTGFALSIASLIEGLIS